MAESLAFDPILAADIRYLRQVPLRVTSGPRVASPAYVTTLGRVLGALERAEQNRIRSVEMVQELVDHLRGSAPQSWAAGSSLYDSACVWEREACALIERADALLVDLAKTTEVP